jgi:hypothetical protein
MDHNVHGAIISGLRSRGIDCLTTDEDGTSSAQDDVILSKSTELDRVLFTTDDDLLAIVAEWQRRGRHFTGLLYGHQLQITIGQAIRDLELAAKVLDPRDMYDRVERNPF